VSCLAKNDPTNKYQTVDEQLIRLLACFFCPTEGTERGIFPCFFFTGFAMNETTNKKHHYTQG